MPMNAEYRGPIDLPGTIPLFPLPGALLLPRGQMPLNIFEPRYLAMVDDSLRDGHRMVGIIQPDPTHSGSIDKLYKIGCVGRITPVSYTHLRAHETGRNLVCRLLLEKKKQK